jgi:transcriptional regulator with XRE-family HTH domain
MITATQCRMARAALRWGVRDLSQRSNVSTTTITRFENGQAFPIKATRAMLQMAFEAEGVRFTNYDRPGVDVPSQS